MQLKLFPRSKVPCDSFFKMPVYKDTDSDTAGTFLSSESYDGGTSTSIVTTEPQDRHVARSLSIPLPDSHVVRTQSEVQLSLDTEVAQQRDLDMFYRLVNGIRARHASSSSSSGNQQHGSSSTHRIPPPYAITPGSLDQRTLPESFVQQSTNKYSHSYRVGEESLFAREQSCRPNDESDVVDSEHWSITGFDVPSDLVENGRPTLANNDDDEDAGDDDDDSGVFVLDL